MARFPLDTSAGVIFCIGQISRRKNSVFIKLAVDTGASFTMISIEAALAIGLDPSKSTKHIEITTANGVVFLPFIQIPSLRCFGIEAKNLKVVCHSLPPESRVEGLLGLDFLKKAKVVLDFGKNVIQT